MPSGNSNQVSGWHPPLDDEALAVNAHALRFWQERGFSAQDCLSVCQEIDSEAMAALVSFSGTREVDVRLTQRTWQRQEGHYPAIAELFGHLIRHPNLLGVQGSFIVWLEDGMWTPHKQLSQRAPIFAFGREITDKFTLLMPDPAYITSGGYKHDLATSEDLCRAHPWESRIATAFWRGAATGLGIEGPDWIQTPRARLALLAKELQNSTMLDASLTRLRHLPMERIEEMTEAGIVSDEVPFDTFFRYKYSVDVDGYACAWKSLFLKLASGATVLKIDSPFEQWYHRRLVPGRHFLRLASDLSNFSEIFAWLQSHDAQAQQIAEQGDAFVRELSLEHALNELAFFCHSIVSAQRDSQG